jgi:hypothetical protein
MDGYEYRSLTTDITELAKEVFVERLNRLGAEGFQLVAAVPHERHGYSHEVHLLFMRTVPGEARGARERHRSSGAVLSR